MAKKIKNTETALRDAHQSLIATPACVSSTKTRGSACAR